MPVNKYCVLALGGALGALARFAISSLGNRNLEMGNIPWGTVCVNLLGTFLLCLLFFSERYSWHTHGHFLIFAATGFLGAFTTFSTFSYEALRLMEIRPAQGVIYLSITILGGFGAGLLGWWLAARHLVRV